MPHDLLQTWINLARVQAKLEMRKFLPLVTEHETYHAAKHDPKPSRIHEKAPTAQIFAAQILVEARRALRGL